MYFGSNVKKKIWSLALSFASFIGSESLKNRCERNQEIARILDAQRKLINKGVKLHGGVSISPEVDLDRIESGVVLNHGVRIFGKDTLLREGTELKAGTYENVITGKNVYLGEGEYYDSVFLEDAMVRYSAQVRHGTLFEEGANAGDFIGTKITILGAYVCLGSFINFCDVVDIGGSATSTDDFLHFNEVGSGMIHYNFSPYGDKFSSYVGPKMAKAVFMKTKKTFVGGQARLIGPNIVHEGSTIAAGCDLRETVPKHKMLLTEGVSSERVEVDFDARIYGKISDKVERTSYIISNLMTLIEWYKKVKIPLYRDDYMQRLVLEGAVLQIRTHINERVEWIDKLVKVKLPLSITLIKEKMEKQPDNEFYQAKQLKKIANQELVIQNWHTIRKVYTGDTSPFFDKNKEKVFVDTVIPTLKQYIAQGKNFAQAVSLLDKNIRAAGIEWLNEGFYKIINSCALREKQDKANV